MTTKTTTDVVVTKIEGFAEKITSREASEYSGQILHYEVVDASNKETMFVAVAKAFDLDKPNVRIVVSSEEGVKSLHVTSLLGIEHEDGTGKWYIIKGLLVVFDQTVMMKKRRYFEFRFNSESLSGDIMIYL